MRLRPALFFPLLFGVGRVCFAADAVTVKISHFGLEGTFAPPFEPTWVEVTIRNNSNQAVSGKLVVAELSLDNDALPISPEITLPLALTSSETRTADVPVNIVAQPHAVLYVRALDNNGKLLGRTGLRVGEKTNGQVIAMLCSTPDVCRAIRQSILLTGSPEEQTRKSSLLRLIQLSQGPSEGWAYSAADIVILAAPISQFSAAQREALEIYLHRGGKLVLVDDQLADSSVLASHSRFLDAYRSHVPAEKTRRVGSGEFIHWGSVSNKGFSDYFRPLGITSGRPEEVFSMLRYSQSGNALGEPAQLNSWLMRRLGTTFRFPSFLELLSWITGYLVLVGIVNFIVLRQIGRPEWAWGTIPTLAVLFSLLLYAVSARNHPSNFGLDEMTVYEFDSLSPVGITTSRLRISAPVRSIVHPVLPGNMVLGMGRRLPFPYNGVPFSLNGGSQPLGEIWLGETWETSFPLRRWSFTDLDFEGQRSSAGTVFRDSLGRLHNESGMNYRQAIVVDERDVLLLGEFSAGAVVDLGKVSHHPYEQETGRRTSGGIPGFPGPPFAHKHPQKEDDFSEEWMKRSDEEFKALARRPFDLTELIRGWPKSGEAVFSETKAIFFGLSHEAAFPAALRDCSPDRKAATLTVITFEEWP